MVLGLGKAEGVLEGCLLREYVVDVKVLWDEAWWLVALGRQFIVVCQLHGQVAFCFEA